MSKIDARDIVKNPVRLLAVGFGSGLVPRIPGTVGTLVGIPLVVVAAPLPILGYLGLVAIFFILGIWLCRQTTRYLGVHDHPVIVWDEVVGYMIAMTGAPMNWWSIIAGFVLFRLFDILKPWPIRWLDQNVEGGFGIMVDDAAAGIYTAMLMHAVIAVF